MKQVDQVRIIITNNTRRKTTNGNSTIIRIRRVESSIKRTITINKTITEEEAAVVEAIVEMDLNTKMMERIHSLMITVEVDEEVEEEAEVDVEAINRTKEEAAISNFKPKTPILLSTRKLARMVDKAVTKLSKVWTNNSLR